MINTYLRSRFIQIIWSWNALCIFMVINAIINYDIDWMVMAVAWLFKLAIILSIWHKDGRNVQNITRHHIAIRCWAPISNHLSNRNTHCYKSLFCVVFALCNRGLSLGFLVFLLNAQVIDHYILASLIIRLFTSICCQIGFT